MKSLLHGLTRWALYTLLVTQNIKAMDASQQKEVRIVYALGEQFLAHGNNQKAVEYLTQASEENYPPALNLLGKYYQNICPKKNPKLAAEYYEKAAKMRYIPSVFNLAYCYLHGIGVEKNYEKARNLYQAIQEYSPKAKLCLGALYIEGLVDKENTFTHDTRLMAHDKSLSKKESVAFGFSLFEPLAENNYPKALLAIARCHELGKGVPQNPAEATSWYIKYLEKKKENENSQQSDASGYEKDISVLKQETENEDCALCSGQLIDKHNDLSSCARGHILHAPCLYIEGEKNPSCPLCKNSLIS